MQSIIACKMAAAVETTSSATGLRGCSEVKSVGIGEVERSWHVSPARCRTPSVPPRGQGLMICVFPLQWHIVPAPQIKKPPPNIWHQPRTELDGFAVARESPFLFYPLYFLARAVVNQATLWKRALTRNALCLFFCWLVSQTARVLLSVPTKIHSRCCQM